MYQVLRTEDGERGQAMLLTVMLLTGVILSTTSLAALITLYQMRQATDVASSNQAIFAADAGVECALYSLKDPSKDCSEGRLTNGAEFKTVAEGDTVKSVGRSRKSARAFEITVDTSPPAPPPLLPPFIPPPPGPPLPPGGAIGGGHLTIPPGGREGGVGGFWSHWFGIKDSRFITGQEYWMFFTIRFDADSDIADNSPNVDIHVDTSRPAGQSVNPSPLNLFFSGNKFKIVTRGGGIFHPTGGWLPNQYYGGNYDPGTDCPSAGLQPTWKKGVRYDFTMHFKMHPTAGFVQAWYAPRDGSVTRAILFCNKSNITNQYGQMDGYYEPWSDLYYGFYAKNYGPGGTGNNDGKTFKLSEWWPRIGTTFNAARANTPVKNTEWGPLDYDPTISTVASPATLSGDDFIYP